MGELHWYINQEPPPVDAGTATETLEYLEACNLLFERGFLSHDRVRSMSADVIQNINKGFSYFIEWLDSLLKRRYTYVSLKCMYLFTLITVHVDPKFPHTSNTQKLFLSWQSKHFHP